MGRKVRSRNMRSKNSRSKRNIRSKRKIRSKRRVRSRKRVMRKNSKRKNSKRRKSIKNKLRGGAPGSVKRDADSIFVNTDKEKVFTITGQRGELRHLTVKKYIGEVGGAEEGRYPHGKGSGDVYIGEPGLYNKLGTFNGTWDTRNMSVGKMVYHENAPSETSDKKCVFEGTWNDNKPYTGSIEYGLFKCDANFDVNEPVPDGGVGGRKKASTAMTGMEPHAEVGGHLGQALARPTLLGRGRLDLVNLKFYTGSIKEGLPHGNGELYRFNHPLYTEYKGEWKNGMWHGHGTYYGPKPGELLDNYRGSWKNGLMDGQGGFVYKLWEGRVYSYEYISGNFSEGLLSDPDPDVDTYYHDDLSRLLRPE